VSEDPEVNSDRLIYTHRLEKGIGGSRRYGIRLAKVSALPQAVVERAERLANSYTETGTAVMDPEGEDAQHTNYVRLFCRIRLLAEEASRCGPDLKEYLKELRGKFVDEE